MLLAVSFIGAYIEVFPNSIANLKFVFCGQTFSRFLRGFFNKVNKQQEVLLVFILRRIEEHKFFVILCNGENKIRGVKV
jgi:hypothetical protein